MKWFYLICFLCCLSSFSQEDVLAKEYFKNGEFEKSQILYQKLYDKNPHNYIYLVQLARTYQQMEQLEKAQELLLNQISKIDYPALLVELGYNYELKNDTLNANMNYNKAIEAVDLKVNFAFSIGRAFEEHSLLDQAIVTYEKAMTLKPSLNFNMQLARIYGEQGNIEKMFSRYIDFIKVNTNYTSNVKFALNEFISEDKDNPNNIILKRVLLKKIQQSPDLLLNDLLSWLFIQQKDYYKAFIQEKAIFKRSPESLDRIESLALIAAQEKHYDIAKDVFQYIVDIGQDPDIVLEAEYNIIKIETEEAKSENYPQIQKKYLSLLSEYGKHPGTAKLQVAYGHFLAFNLRDTDQVTQFLKESLELQLSNYQASLVKLELADILVLQEKFNEALIYYTQIQRSMKNSTISQEARFKVAKTSYFKGDFKWAESQLKILKSSTSQLIANDALDLMLLISDNKYEDSTQTALKLYAKADLLAFQNKSEQAITILDEIIESHKGKTIYDQALFMQAQLFEQLGQYQKAETNYIEIIADYKDEILADDTYFALGELYLNHLGQSEKAKDFYEQIIFNYQDSIYFVESRKKYRMLRGDAIN